MRLMRSGKTDLDLSVIHCTREITPRVFLYLIHAMKCSIQVSRFKIPSKCRSISVVQ